MPDTDHTARGPRQTGGRAEDAPLPAPHSAGGSCPSPCTRPSLRLPGPPEAGPGITPRSSPPGPSGPPRTPASKASVPPAPASTQGLTGPKETTLTGSGVCPRPPPKFLRRALGPRKKKRFRRLRAEAAGEGSWGGMVSACFTVPSGDRLWENKARGVFQREDSWGITQNRNV